MSEKNNIKKAKVYFGSLFQRFNSWSLDSVLSGLVVK
jgi:ABC-type histidine transport system ATPase subunit